MESAPFLDNDHSKASSSRHSNRSNRSRASLEIEKGDAPSWFSIWSKKRAQNNPVMVVVLMTCVMSGVDFIFQPEIFSYSGVILGTLFYAIYTYGGFTGSNIMVKIAQDTGMNNYSDIIQDCYGSFATLFLNILIIIQYGGTVLVFIMVLGSLTSRIVTEHATTLEHNWYLSSYIFSMLWVICIVLPLSMTHTLGNLGIVTYYSIFVVAITYFMVIIGGPYSYYQEHAHDRLRLGEWKGGLESVGSVVFSLGFTPAVLHSYEACDSMTQANFSSYLLMATIFGTLIDYTVGIIGYVTFRSSTKVDILENFSSTLATWVQSLMVILLAVMIPTYFVVVRDAINRVVLFVAGFDPQTINQNELIKISTISLLALFTASTIILDVLAGGEEETVIEMLGIMGGVSGSLVLYIIPGILGLHYLTTYHRDRLESFLMVALGVITFVLALAGSLT
jgi:amino acid permease